MKRVCFCLFLLFCTALAAFAQYAADAGLLAARPVVSWGDACFWVFAAAGHPYSESDAAYYAAKIKAIPKKAGIDDGADFAGLALLIMRLNGIRGGFFYSMFPSRRYAFRELVYLGIYNEEDDPGGFVSGVRLLGILGGISAVIHEVK